MKRSLVRLEFELLSLAEGPVGGFVRCLWRLVVRSSDVGG